MPVLREGTEKARPKSRSPWERFREKHPEGSDVGVKWFDGWRICKILRYEGDYPVCETRNGGILMVEKLASLLDE